MNRTTLEKHILARTPYNQIAAALSLALFIVVLLYAGWTALLVVFVLWSAALAYGGFASSRREFAKVVRAREEDRHVHDELIARRGRLVQFADTAFEERSTVVAARFGRVDQNVDDLVDPRKAVRARHAAELVAQGVISMRFCGFPVTVFDLDVINEADFASLVKMGKAERAIEASMVHLTVCAVTLPYPLPYLSSLAAWEPGMLAELEESMDDVPAELRHTDDPDFASLLLSVPKLLRAAHDLDLLWTISGDQLVAAAMSTTGITPESALRRATDLAAVAAALPWDRLEPFRRDTADIPAPWPLHRSRFVTHQWWVGNDESGPTVRRWEHDPIGKTGTYAFVGIGSDLGAPRGAFKVS
ncbi:hypothetical protein GCM10027598_78970 [Amycolatopsis oliviviridis]|uniref:Uncharacterized protein n=1 Tax=Amycolatopsis oliviviridis TaxID=1471590 RepID=A0ABQ3L5E8_9PSEU|nr:hypothetical protein [Amycolatopsis oliviviridis]GHH05227.1 hypothetical protein GCM10017790_08900 [Amycolatopsis oliviviridis]